MSWLPLAAAACGFSSLLHADVTIVEHVDGVGQDTDTTPAFGAGKSMDITMMFKAGHARLDMSTTNSIIEDLKSGETVIMTHAAKNYATLKEAEDVAEHWYGVPPLSSRSDAPATPKHGGTPLTPTGRKETISGYAANEYSWKGAGWKETLWLSKAVPGYANLLKEMSAASAKGLLGATPAGSSLDTAALPGFPVCTVHESEPGQPITTTVVSISNNPIADSEFKIPAGYKHLTMP